MHALCLLSCYFATNDKSLELRRAFALLRVLSSSASNDGLNRQGLGIETSNIALTTTLMASVHSRERLTQKGREGIEAKIFLLVCATPFLFLVPGFFFRKLASQQTRMTLSRGTNRQRKRWAQKFSSCSLNCRSSLEGDHFTKYITYSFSSCIFSWRRVIHSSSASFNCFLSFLFDTKSSLSTR